MTTDSAAAACQPAGVRNERTVRCHRYRQSIIYSIITIKPIYHLYRALDFAIYAQCFATRCTLIATATARTVPSGLFD